VISKMGKSNMSTDNVSKAIDYLEQVLKLNNENLRDQVKEQAKYLESIFNGDKVDDKKS